MGISRVFTDLKFRHLTNLAQPGDSRNLLFATEQSGLIRVFPNRQDVADAGVYLDITDRVNEGGNEEGLLGLAFDPGYESNGRLYVYYSTANPRRSVVSRFSVTPNNPAEADPNSEVIILEIPQPFRNHNGGQLAFGPDGYLYVGLGDGGSRGDPDGNGQNTATLLGSILRVDVSRRTDSPGYRIPGDNPFVSTVGARAEIWAYGLRNPWRFSFDRDTGGLWLADVGQNLWEEIDVIKRGGNYGWNAMEGAHCFRPKTGCESAGLKLPVTEYSTQQGCSVIGGYVYRGQRLPSLFGAYVYADYCSGRIWGLRYDGQSVTDQRLLAELDNRITSFGEDQEGNVYILSRDSGIYRLVRPEDP